jgi:Ca2+:H+ antiporter
MKETSAQSKNTDHIRSWTGSHGGTQHSTTRPDPLPVSNATASNDPVAAHGSNHAHFAPPSTASDGPGDKLPSSTNTNAGHTGASEADGGFIPPSTTSTQTAGPGSVLSNGGGTEAKKHVVSRFLMTTKAILLYSKLNLLLVLVPIGIIVGMIPNMPPGLIFAMNAVAIIPLAGLLSFATETVARRLGDSFGALLNITFGNAVELIIL